MVQRICAKQLHILWIERDGAISNLAKRKTQERQSNKVFEQKHRQRSNQTTPLT
jgi:hypothetical protein